MYIFGGNDVNRTFADMWRISLKDIVAYVDRQWETELSTITKKGKGKGSSVDGAEPEIHRETHQKSVGPHLVPFKLPRWQCLCRDSAERGR